MHQQLYCPILVGGYDIYYLNTRVIDTLWTGGLDGLDGLDGMDGSQGGVKYIAPYCANNNKKHFV